MTEALPLPFDLQPVYEFRTAVFAGFVRPAGHLHGVVLSHDALERPITRPGGCLLNLEHYTAVGRTGIFVPRDQLFVPRDEAEIGRAHV